MTNSLPITDLIEIRCQQLGLKKTALVARLGYVNQSKGLRRLDRILAGDFAGLSEIIKRIPAALEVPSETVNEAIEQTTKILQKMDEDARRAAFQPHAIILTERTRPTSITMAALTNAPRHKLIEFDLTKPPSTFLAQAISILNHRLRELNGGIPMFGKATGLVINYSFDRRAEFDLEGNLLSIAPKALQHQEATLYLG